MAQDDVRIKAKVDANVDQRDNAGQRPVIRLSTILKSKVLIQQDRPAGNVVDVVLSDGGCIEYLVVMHDDQNYVVPYSATQVRYADQVVFVDLTPAQFQNVTYFSGNSWPNLYAPAYRNQIYSFYGLSVPRAGVSVNGSLPNTNRARADNDPKTDPATPETRKTLKPELPKTPTTPDLKNPTLPESTPNVKKPIVPGDQPGQTPPKGVIPSAPDRKPVVPPTTNPIPKDSKEIPKPKLPL